MACYLAMCVRNQTIIYDDIVYRGSSKICTTDPKLRHRSLLHPFFFP